MPFVENHHVRIHYEVYGSGPPIVLLHGFTNNIQIWKAAGYVAALERSHQVILIDQRGHGQSDKPHSPADYRLDQRMEDVIRVIDHLGCERVGLLGYSMGGWLAFALSLHFSERVVALVVGGAHPYQESFKEFEAIDGSDPDAFIAALSTFIGEEIAPRFHPLILRNDLAALSAAARKRPSLEELLTDLAMPCLLFVGENDQRVAKVKGCLSKIPNAELFVVPSSGHVMALLKSDAVLPVIVRFFDRDDCS